VRYAFTSCVSSLLVTTTLTRPFYPTACEHRRVAPMWRQQNEQVLLHIGLSALGTRAGRTTVVVI
jgi:hypothetical protein